MSDAEIASALGVKPSSVRMPLTRARSKARKAIEKKM
jgi:DNA-directed RNA polymerase specialized sigma24 family protein